MYQLDHLDEPDYAVTSSTVETCRLLQREKARGLVNAVLRKYLRQKNENPERRASAWHSMPEWLIRLLRASWPADWYTIVHACNEKPPLTLRINGRQCQPDSYLRRLRELGLAGFESPVCRSAITLASSPSRLRFSFICSVRLGKSSEVTNSWGAPTSRRWQVLPPGAAHASSTVRPRKSPAKSGVSCADAS